MSLETDLQEAIRQHAASRELWQQQSTLHEIARTNLDQQVKQFLESPSILQGRGVGTKKLCVLTGQIIRERGLVAGTGDFSNMSRDDGVTAEGYLHLDTGIKPSEARMVYYEIYGVDFLAQRLIDDKCWGYIAYSGIHSQAATTQSVNPFFYLGSNGNGYLRLTLTGQHYTTICIDALNLYIGAVSTLTFVGGRITAKTIETI